MILCRVRHNRMTVGLEKIYSISFCAKLYLWSGFVKQDVGLKVPHTLWGAIFFHSYRSLPFSSSFWDIFCTRSIHPQIFNDVLSSRLHATVDVWVCFGSPSCCRSQIRFLFMVQLSWLQGIFIQNLLIFSGINSSFCATFSESLAATQTQSRIFPPTCIRVGIMYFSMLPPCSLRTYFVNVGAKRQFQLHQSTALVSRMTGTLLCFNVDFKLQVFACRISCRHCMCINNKTPLRS